MTGVRNMQDDPYAAYRDDKIPTNLMIVLTQLVDELVRAEADVEEVQKQLEIKQGIVKDLKENKIPTAAEGLEGKFKLMDGRTLEVREEIRASIAGDKKEPAIKWLDENDFGHIVKRQLIMEFGKGEDELYKEVLEYLRNFSKWRKLVIKDKSDVHHMTLSSWVRERLAEGIVLDKNMFGIFHQKIAKVKE